ncbi:unnamed protein product [Protopolystoma xenopodis]|uniref:Uncharacterized protein n=1 Tax=Protopolystoma xenopodis TaxID=117903 RepID=A0A3S5ABV3_9PLAT|nr:unnamed protein product [Protopolystoma xenopodis]
MPQPTRLDDRQPINQSLAARCMQIRLTIRQTIGPETDRQTDKRTYGQTGRSLPRQARLPRNCRPENQASFVAVSLAVLTEQISR